MGGNEIKLPAATSFSCVQEDWKNAARRGDERRSDARDEERARNFGRARRERDEITARRVIYEAKACGRMGRNEGAGRERGAASGSRGANFTAL